jgi:hypothetical protein
MAKGSTKNPLSAKGKKSPNAFARRDENEAARRLAPYVHVLRPGVCCDTEKRGYPTPEDRSPLEIVVDATEGFIPLWEKDSTLRWRFRESSLQYFERPEAARAEIKQLLSAAIFAWGDSAPVKFANREDAWDFEVVVRDNDDCDVMGCVLASAFFPDPGRHELVIYPKMFEQDRAEQIETLIHEIGHIFGLRHFFAQVREAAWPSQVFGTHDKFSIMNYGTNSTLTDADKSDLRRLYELAWSGQLTQINGTPIRFMKPFHTSGAAAVSFFVTEPAAVTTAIYRR